MLATQPCGRLIESWADAHANLPIRARWLAKADVVRKNNEAEAKSALITEGPALSDKAIPRWFHRRLPRCTIGSSRWETLPEPQRKGLRSRCSGFRSLQATRMTSRTLLAFLGFSIAAGCDSDTTLSVGEAFTLKCRGVHNSDGNDGGHAFSATIDPQTDGFYMYDWEVFPIVEGLDVATFDGRLWRMNNKISRLYGIDDRKIEVGAESVMLKIDRRTGGYSFGTTSAGVCTLDEETTPIPYQLF